MRVYPNAPEGFIMRQGFEQCQEAFWRYAVGGEVDVL